MQEVKLATHASRALKISGEGHMNWKSDLQLSDFPLDTEIEVLCRRCGHVHYERTQDIMRLHRLKHARLDDVERALCCSKPGCKGGVRIALIHDDKNEAFVGGMA